MTRESKEFQVESDSGQLMVVSTHQLMEGVLGAQLMQDLQTAGEQIAGKHYAVHCTGGS